jgi:hypothetical protein
MNFSKCNSILRILMKSSADFSERYLKIVYMILSQPGDEKLLYV